MRLQTLRAPSAKCWCRRSAMKDGNNNDNEGIEENQGKERWNIEHNTKKKENAYWAFVLRSRLFFMFSFVFVGFNFFSLFFHFLIIFVPTKTRLTRHTESCWVFGLASMMTTSSWIHSESELINFKLISHFLPTCASTQQLLYIIKWEIHSVCFTPHSQIRTQHIRTYDKALFYAENDWLRQPFYVLHCCFRFSMGSSRNISSVFSSNSFLSIRYIMLLFFENNIVTVDVVWLICTWHSNMPILTVIWWIGLKSLWGRKVTNTSMGIYFLCNYFLMLQQHEGYNNSNVLFRKWTDVWVIQFDKHVHFSCSIFRKSALVWNVI